MDDVMSEILLRLPSKSVVRYRAVCRSWRRITSCPYFLAARDAGGILRRPPGAGAGPRPVRMLVHCSIWTARFVCVEERDDVMVVCESAHDKKLNTQHAAGLYHLRDNKFLEPALDLGECSLSEFRFKEKPRPTCLLRLAPLSRLQIHTLRSTPPTNFPFSHI
ncbi:Os05g0588600 [Oryza sativa Japonica Group]|uniref:F-box domain-containing protein n=3 Tax=Oryza sativa subsp. japonica TaxID=39947 RepID=A0A8J8Y2U6_ORYSJ|nr:hypothetical protein OsJ_19731 [Oryza sativa Japonica Group]USI00482.1 F-box domain-containing protein [Oryza sativa Japonica Group]BAS95602.1 Os05g0588600 [Oryza sativa Japonica Group]